MPSRADQLQSYQFLVRRVISAFVTGETDPARSPIRRAASATLAGLLVAALGLGGAAAWGLLSPGGSTRWRDPKVVIVEKESGALFVYRDDDHAVHPVLNYASARLLISAGGDVPTVIVARRSLDGVARGVALGIPGAPSSLPAAARLRHGPWTVCSMRGSDGTPRSTLFVAGDSPTGGSPLAEGDAASGLLVTDSDRTRYLVYRHRRHRMRDQDPLLARLVWNARPPVAVASALLNAIPAGPDLVRLAPGISGFGSPLSTPSGARVGEVFAVKRTGGSGQELFVARADGFASLTEFQAEVLLADPLYTAKIGTRAPTPLDRADFGRWGQTPPPFLPDSGGDGALPAVVPGLQEAPDGGLCAPVAGPAGTTEIRVGVPLPEASAAPVRRGPDGTVLADRVFVGPGSGALVTAEASTGADRAVVVLITDTGRRYPIVGDQVLAALGYSAARPDRMPAELVSLVPAGPALDPEAARTPA